MNYRIFTPSLEELLYVVVPSVNRTELALPTMVKRPY